jgi:hypothetical protein
MDRPPFLYHTTKRENLESIMDRGLLNKGICIYCSERPDSWWNEDGYAKLEVDIRGMDDVRMTTFDEPGLDEILIWVDRIEPERLRVIDRPAE